MPFYDPLVNEMLDIQELANTYYQISLARTRCKHSLFNHYLTLFFPELRQGVRLRYAFIQKHAGQYPVRCLCRMMAVHPSSYYAWCKKALSNRERDDQRLLGLIKHAWLESGGVYGYRKGYQDLREAG